jgi:hypothetical protein
MARRTMVFALVLFMCTAGRAQTRFARDFSADLVSNNNGRQTTARFYASKSRTRSEILRNGVPSTVMIMDLENHTGWQLRPNQKMAFDMSAMLKSAQGLVNHNGLGGGPVNGTTPCAALPGYTCRNLGSDEVNGRHTQKWELKDKDGQVTTAWIDPSLPLAVKTQSAQGESEFRNIKEGPQPEQLFQVPADYRKTSFGVGAPR